MAQGGTRDLVVDRGEDEESDVLGPGPDGLGARVRRWGETHHSPLVILCTLAVCLVVWVARRPGQLVRPYVWAEESVVLQRWIDNGMSGAFEPVSGYMIMPVHVLLPAAGWLSFAHLPAVMYAGATAVFVVTLLLVLVPASRWGGLPSRVACAVLLVLVPVNPETFGVLLYSFWWLSLWPMIVLCWRRPLYGLRIPVLVLASLSSPVAGAIAVVHALSWVRSRTRHDLVSAAALVPGLVLQLFLVKTTSQRGDGLLGSLRDVLEQSARSAGIMLTRWLYPTDAIDWTFVVVVGVALLAFLLVAGVSLARRGSDAVLLLLVTSLIYLVVSAVPAALVVDPVYTGRYLFLPQAALLWALAYLVAQSGDVPYRKVGIGALVAAMLSLGPTFSRTGVQVENDLSWETQLELCQGPGGEQIMSIPVYTDGSKSGLWSLEVTSEQCRDLVGSSLTGRFGG